MSQHQTEISQLQCLLRSTQERLQKEFQTNVEQVHNCYNFFKDLGFLYIILNYRLLLFYEYLSI